MIPTRAIAPLNFTVCKSDLEFLPVFKAMWLTSDQLCSKLLKVALPKWLELGAKGAPFSEVFLACTNIEQLFPIRRKLIRFLYWWD